MDATMNILKDQWEADPHKWAVTLMGPYIMGFAVDVFLYGVLCCQVSHYCSLYSDKLSIRVLVAVLFLMHTLKSILSMAEIWIQAIASYPDIVKALELLFLDKWFLAMPVMGAVLDAYVQAFFCRRLLVFSHNNIFVVGSIVMIFVFALTACIAASAFMSQDNPNFGWWFQAHIVSTLIGDILLTSSTAYFLIKTKKNVLPQTAGLLNALIRLTFQTALPATICALLSVSFTAANNYTQVTCNLALPKLYAVTMLWTLNARKAISVMGGSSSHLGTSTCLRINNIELAPFSTPLQIHTQNETVQHIDYPDHTHSKARIDDNTYRGALEMEKLGSTIM